MLDPLFWLGMSIFLVAVSLTAVLVAALPAIQELARAARSAEKLFDTLQRELPPTLEAIRLTGLEISELTDDIDEGVKSAAGVAKQVDRTLGGAKQQVGNAQQGTRSAIAGAKAGMKAAWRAFKRPRDYITLSEQAIEAREFRERLTQEINSASEAAPD